MAARRADLRANPGHLIVRFFRSIRASALTPRDQTEVAALLQAEERSLYWAQSTADQRHGLESARAVLRVSPGRLDLARAALLHDIGKRHARLGPVGRSVASVVEIVGLSSRGRMRAYLDHGPHGAADLEDAGSEALVVAFARHHHGERPEEVPEEDWAALKAADSR